MKRTLPSLFAASAFALASPASAVIIGCQNGDVSSAADDCSGFYKGNLLNNSPGGKTGQQTGLGDIGFTYADWDDVWTNAVKIDSLNGNTTLDFSTLLNGATYIGVHFGAGNGGPGFDYGAVGRPDNDDVTAFYKLNADNLASIQLNWSASSAAVLYRTGEGVRAVPEPSTWAMMIFGFSLVGITLRRRRTRVAFA